LESAAHALNVEFVLPACEEARGGRGGANDGDFAEDVVSDSATDSNAGDVADVRRKYDKLRRENRRLYRMLRSTGGSGAAPAGPPAGSRRPASATRCGAPMSSLELPVQGGAAAAPASLEPLPAAAAAAGAGAGGDGGPPPGLGRGATADRRPRARKGNAIVGNGRSQRRCPATARSQRPTAYIASLCARDRDVRVVTHDDS